MSAGSSAFSSLRVPSHPSSTRTIHPSINPSIHPSTHPSLHPPRLLLVNRSLRRHSFRPRRLLFSSLPFGPLRTLARSLPRSLARTLGSFSASFAREQSHHVDLISSHLDQGSPPPPRDGLRMPCDKQRKTDPSSSLAATVCCPFRPWREGGWRDGTHASSSPETGTRRTAAAAAAAAAKQLSATSVSSLLPNQPSNQQSDTPA